MSDKILIYVKGGIVQDIAKSDPDIDVEVFDVDNLAKAFDTTLAELDKAWNAKVFALKYNNYSVLLGYPDGDTFFVWVRALNPSTAIDEAFREVIESNPEMTSDQFTVLLVMPGHVDALLRKEDF